MTQSQAVYIRSLARAAEVVGSTQLLAQLLGVQPKELVLWISGLAEPPVDVFLKVVDLLMPPRREMARRSEGAAARPSASTASPPLR